MTVLRLTYLFILRYLLFIFPNMSTFINHWVWIKLKESYFWVRLFSDLSGPLHLEIFYHWTELKKNQVYRSWFSFEAAKFRLNYVWRLKCTLERSRSDHVYNLCNKKTFTPSKKFPWAAVHPKGVDSRLHSHVEGLVNWKHLQILSYVFYRVRTI